MRIYRSQDIFSQSLLGQGREACTFTHPPHTLTFVCTLTSPQSLVHSPAKPQTAPVGTLTGIAVETWTLSFSRHPTDPLPLASTSSLTSHPAPLSAGHEGGCWELGKTAGDAELAGGKQVGD